MSAPRQECREEVCDMNPATQARRERVHRRQIDDTLAQAERLVEELTALVAERENPALRRQRLRLVK
jgi:hypothetical protein